MLQEQLLLYNSLSLNYLIKEKSQYDSNMQNKILVNRVGTKWKSKSGNRKKNNQIPQIDVYLYIQKFNRYMRN